MSYFQGQELSRTDQTGVCQRKSLNVRANLISMLWRDCCVPKRSQNIAGARANTSHCRFWTIWFVLLNTLAFGGRRKGKKGEKRRGKEKEEGEEGRKRKEERKREREEKRKGRGEGEERR